MYTFSFQLKNILFSLCTLMWLLSLLYYVVQYFNLLNHLKVKFHEIDGIHLNKEV